MCAGGHARVTQPALGRFLPTPRSAAAPYAGFSCGMIHWAVRWKSESVARDPGIDVLPPRTPPA